MRTVYKYRYVYIYTYENLNFQNVTIIMPTVMKEMRHKEIKLAILLQYN